MLYHSPRNRLSASCAKIFLKRTFSLIENIFFLLFLLLLVSCGNSDPTPGSSSRPPEKSATSSGEASSKNSEEDISISINDLQSNLNQWHRYALNISHHTDQYLTAEIYGAVTDSAGNVLGDTTVFVNNLGPSPMDWASEPFLAKNSSEYFTDYQIVSYQFSDDPLPMPEITDENINSYLRLTIEDLGDIDKNRKHITAVIHNLTPQYFSGEISFTVKDAQGEVLTESTETYDYIKPYSDTSTFLWMPLADEYSVEYQINTYAFSE